MDKKIPLVANIQTDQGMTIAQPGQEIIYYGLSYRLKISERDTQKSIKREKEFFEKVKAFIEKPPIEHLVFAEDGTIERYVAADLENKGEMIVTYRLPFVLKYSLETAKLVEAAKERRVAPKPKLWGRLALQKK